MIINNRGTFNSQKETIKKRGNSIAAAIKSIKHKTIGPSPTPLLLVWQAKLIPVITYGSECLRGRDAAILDSTVSRAARIIFNLPKNVLPAQIRLEFGLQSQELACKGAYVKSWYRIKRAKAGTLNSYLWKEIHRKRGCAAMSYLTASKECLGLEELWAASGSNHCFKQIINMTVKKLSLVEDKAVLTERTHRWFVVQSYAKPSPQSYLGTGFNWGKKEKYLHFQMGILPSLPHLPPWKRSPGQTTCRLCEEASESVLHLLCICGELQAERCQLLKPFFVRKEIRTCRQAVMACFRGGDVQLACRFVQFMEAVGEKLGHLQQITLI